MIPSDSKITINGLDSTELAQSDALVRAVVISLFTWRRASPQDIVDGERFGFWGDMVEPSVANDKIGSRLWLLSRAKIVNETFSRAREYALEALQWLIDDGVASKVEVLAERFGVSGLALVCTIYRVNADPLTLRFDKAWESIRGI